MRLGDSPPLRVAELQLPYRPVLPAMLVSVALCTCLCRELDVAAVLRDAARVNDGSRRAAAWPSDGSRLWLRVVVASGALLARPAVREERCA